MLKELCFTDYFKETAKKDQGALVQLLMRFKQSLTADVQTQLTAKRCGSAKLTTVTGYADTLNNANITRESYKSSRRTSTQAAVEAFNEIYENMLH